MLSSMADFETLSDWDSDRSDETPPTGDRVLRYYCLWLFSADLIVLRFIGLLCNERLLKLYSIAELLASNILVGWIFVVSSPVFSLATSMAMAKVDACLGSSRRYALATFRSI